jgi:hypothetical protein
MTVFWNIAVCSVIKVYRYFKGDGGLHHQVLMEAASTSEKSANFCQNTRSNIPEDGHLHTCRREKLKFRHWELKLL